MTKVIFSSDNKQYFTRFQFYTQEKKKKAQNTAWYQKNFQIESHIFLNLTAKKYAPFYSKFQIRKGAILPSINI